MRISPLVIYCLSFDKDEDIINAVVNEVSLTHCADDVFYACNSYVLAVNEIVRSGDYRKAFEKAENYVK